jgi:hypothetical protein
MTLQELKSVLDNALKAAYERRDKTEAREPNAYHTRFHIEQNIALFQDLHLGVIRTMEQEDKTKKASEGYNCPCPECNPGY